MGEGGAVRHAGHCGLTTGGGRLMTHPLTSSTSRFAIATVFNSFNTSSSLTEYSNNSVSERGEKEAEGRVGDRDWYHFTAK